MFGFIKKIIGLLSFNGSLFIMANVSNVTTSISLNTQPTWLLLLLPWISLKLTKDSVTIHLQLILVEYF